MLDGERGAELKALIRSRKLSCSENWKGEEASSLAKLTQMLVERHSDLRELKSFYLPTTFRGVRTENNPEFAALRKICEEREVEVVYDDYYRSIDMDSQVSPAFWKAHRRAGE